MARNLAALVVKWNMTRADPGFGGGKPWCCEGPVFSSMVFWSFWRMGRKLTSEACYKDRDDDDGTTDYTVLCLQMAVHGIRIRPRLVLICTPLFYPRRFWKIVCFELVQGCKNDAILPYFMLPEERYGSYQFYSFWLGIVWNLKMC